MNKKGFTLMEILVAALIMVLVMTGLTSVFVAGRRHILHTRSRIQAAELGRLFLTPLQMDVRQDQWGSSNCLRTGTGCPGAQTIDSITYTPTYTRTLDSPITNLNKVKVTINWTEPSS
jgi:prepilin-type N-terminal cleavage/methylation domain-containing protein